MPRTRRLSQRLVRWISLCVSLALVLSCLAIVPLQNASSKNAGPIAQSPNGKGQKVSPVPPQKGPPPGNLPNLDDVRRRKPEPPQAPPPLSSTARSRHNPLAPRNGRKVGDPFPPGFQGAVSRPAQLNSATVAKHAATRTTGETSSLNAKEATYPAKVAQRFPLRPSANSYAGLALKNRSSSPGVPKSKLNHTRSRTTARAPSPPPVPDDQYVQNFYQWALLRAPNSTELTYWDDMLRMAYAHGQGSEVIAARELGKTVFESSEYAARARSDRDYVYDLYKTFLMRDPDQGGWDGWTAAVPIYGRDQVRRGFDESLEFQNLMATMTPDGGVTSAVSSLLTARVDPNNQPGSGLLGRPAEWSVPLLGLPGRTGLDLGLSLSYSSMVWTRSGSYVYFDEDNGFPSPGFRLGFPTIQELFFDVQVGQNAYVMIMSSGNRVELRQVGASNVYEAADSSYLQLIDTGNLLVRASDGTQLSYGWFNYEYRCTQIKDRNGNFITVNYDWRGHITTITDTLGRVVTFNYDGNANLLSITQTWNGQTPPHYWATFSWGPALSMNVSGFSGASVVNTYTGESIPVLRQVGLDDGSYYAFEYTGAGQVNMIRRYTSDNIERSHTAYDYDNSPSDCPRITQTRVWALDWTGVNGVPSEVATQYDLPGDGSHRMTAPDGTVFKEFYGTGWQKGLTTQTEVLSGGVPQKWTTTSYTQDNSGVSYQMNPRVTETNVYDAAGNRNRSTVSYQTFSLPSGASCSLPSDTYQYWGDAATVLRRSHIDYNLSSTYLNLRIVGLPSSQFLYDGSNNLMTRTDIQYDESGSVQYQSLPTQHDDSNYGSGFVAGRANISSTRRYDASNTSQYTTSSVQYNTAGSVIGATDPLNHVSTISYTDSFSDSTNHNTFAYPTTLTDADGYQSFLQYNFDFGAKTLTQGPPPANQSQGIIQTFSYDAAARLQQVTTTNNGAYTRYVYGPNYTQSFSSVNNVTDDAYSIQYLDGAGRTILAGGNHPGSSGGYRAVWTQYDLMGRMLRQSNPTEINAGWITAGDDAAGWVFSIPPVYDWKGRVLRAYNQDGSYKTAEYTGCGCAGGEVVTVTDEVGRQQKVYSDVLGRHWKTEVLNWDSSVYSTTENTLNARDQVTLIRQFQGTDTSGVYQDTLMSYDGYGRLQTKHVPEQNTGATTTYSYNDDDTIYSMTDARGATNTFSYNNRHLVTGVVFSAPAGIPSTPSVSLSYDAAGNKTSMTDGTGSVSYDYDQLSHMTSETRYISALGKYYHLSYGYNLGGSLTSVSMSDWSQQVNYGYDPSGRLTSVTGSGFTNTRITGTWPNWTYVTNSIPTFVSGIAYRAWGAVKQMSYGNSAQLAMSYNNRLLATQYQLGLKNWDGTSYTTGSNYTYYDDGKINYDGRLDNSIFDRKYTYDQAGRIKDALTGSEARGGNTADGPFKQTYGYDGWGNTTSQTQRLWTGSTTTNNYSFSNNRRQDFGYDANGFARSTYDGSLWYSHDYDAAGKRTHFVPNIDYVGGLPVFETNDSFDGAGFPTARVNTQRWQDPDTGQINTNTTTSYYLHSTALGGAVVANLDAQGNKTSSNIYAQGMQLATETIWNTSANYARIEWQHSEPAAGSSVTSNFAANELRTQELDPLGADVTAPPDPPDQFNFQPPNYLDSKFASSPIEIEGGPSAEYEEANAAWAGQMEDMYDRGLAEYYWAKGDRDAVQQILARNPNVGIEYNIVGFGLERPLTGSIFGSEAAGFLNRLGALIDNGSLVQIGGPGFSDRREFAHAPNNSPSAEDPRSISSPPNKNCSLTVSFEQGTFYNGNGELPNGPSSNKTLGYDSYGLGFTVSGKVASGGIGKIGDDPNPQNSKGRWSIFQLTADTITANGQVIRDQELRSDFNTQSYYDVTGNSFSWYDHPGSPTPGNLITSYERNMKFQVSAYDGKHFCGVTFSATFTFNGQWSVHWRKGY
jgi:YD repeat-containing protein